MGALGLSAYAEIWLLIYFDISCMMINRRFTSGITNARWYICTTGGNNGVFASFILIMTSIIDEFLNPARKYVLVDIFRSGSL